MQFEYDQHKSDSNKSKRGIDFEEGKAIWDDSCALQVDLAYEKEKRYFVTGEIKGKMWTAICTDRGVNVRIISVRRAHKSEERLYEESKRKRIGHNV